MSWSESFDKFPNLTRFSGGSLLLLNSVLPPVRLSCDWEAKNKPEDCKLALERSLLKKKKNKKEVFSLFLSFDLLPVNKIG